MTRQRFGNKHATIITLDDGTIVLQSYQTIVAARLSDGTFTQTSVKWSGTTSRQISQFVSWLIRNGHNLKSGASEVRPQHYFDHELMA